MAFKWPYIQLLAPFILNQTFHWAYIVFHWASPNLIHYVLACITHALLPLQDSLHNASIPWYRTKPTKDMLESPLLTIRLSSSSALSSTLKPIVCWPNEIVLWALRGFRTKHTTTILWYFHEVHTKDCTFLFASTPIIIISNLSAGKLLFQIAMSFTW